MREASARSVDVYIASVRDRLRSALQEAQAQSTARGMPTEMVLQQKNRLQ